MRGLLVVAAQILMHTTAGLLFQMSRHNPAGSQLLSNVSMKHDVPSTALGRQSWKYYPHLVPYGVVAATSPHPFLGIVDHLGQGSGRVDGGLIFLSSWMARCSTRVLHHQALFVDLFPTWYPICEVNTQNESPVPSRPWRTITHACTNGKFRRKKFAGKRRIDKVYIEYYWARSRSNTCICGCCIVRREHGICQHRTTDEMGGSGAEYQIRDPFNMAFRKHNFGLQNRISISFLPGPLAFDVDTAHRGCCLFTAARVYVCNRSLGRDMLFRACIVGSAMCIKLILLSRSRASAKDQGT